jgi:predicted DCC family thiol-disulfide oxidoreductase YuxK
MAKRNIPGIGQNQALVLFDGVCNMCNGFATFVLARDPNERFKFAPLQSNFGKWILQEYNLPQEIQSIILIEPDGSCYQR